MRLPIPAPFPRLWLLTAIAGALLALAVLSFNPGAASGQSAPSLTRVAVTSTPVADSTYALGEIIRVTLTFSEAVNITGTPRLKIDMDPAHWGQKWANYESGTGTASLIFAHTVVQPNISTQGIAVLANTLELNGGTIRSATNTNALLAHTGLAHDPNHKVDWRREAPATQNSPATGAPTISGTVQVGETLSADTSDISDADGLANAAFTYQWLADAADISGATGSTYTLAAAAEGKAVKVQVSFTDDAGNQESVTSAATTAVAPKPNSPATGAPAITGTAQVGETLTANTSGISDDEGLTNATFTYQWLADDADISGATGSTYTLADAEEGKAVKVGVSFTDDAGHDETLTSAATAAVAAARPEDADQYEPDQQVIADVRSYAQETQHGYDHVLRWMRVLKTFGALEDMTSAQAQDNADTYSADRWDPVVDELTDLESAQGDHEPDQQVVADVRGYAQETQHGYDHVLRWMRVLKTLDALEDMTSTEAQGYADTYSAERWDPVVAELTAMEANTPATGAPTITGTALVGETLTAGTSGISDDDGLTNATFSYQWLADDADVSGATGSSYTLAAADQGKAIKVRVSFTDDAGHDETLTSTATTAVAPATPPAKPSGLIATAEAGSLVVAVDWDDVEGADDYLVRWRLHGPGNPLNDGERPTSSDTQIAVSHHAKWVVRVEACNDAGCGPGVAQAVEVTDPEPEQQSDGEGYQGELGEVLVELSLRRPAGGVSGQAPGTRGASGQSGTPQTTSIVYVIDDSGSMDGDFPEVRTALEAVRDTDMTNTKVALIAFGTDATTIFGLTDHPADAQSRPGPWTDARINEFGGKLGSTLYAKPLENAKALLDADAAALKKIVFLTDGQAQRPSTVVQQLIDAGITVDTIGFGDPSTDIFSYSTDNFSVLEAIAADTNGVHRTVAKPSQGTTNTPAVTATSLSDILEGAVADNTATLFLVDYSFSAYLPNTNTLEPALAAAAEKAGESSGTGRQVGLARFLGDSSLLLDSESAPKVRKYHVVNSVGSASLRMDEEYFDFYSSGSTDIDHALQQAYSTISGVTATNKRMVLITDGISATAVQDSTLNSYKNDSTVTLDVVAWGAHADRVQLKTWADSATGTFSVAKAGPAVPKGFRATAGDATVALGWIDPGDSAITKYQYRHWLRLSGSGPTKTEWMDLPATGADTTTHIITGIENGYGLWALEVRATYDDTPGGSASYFYIDHWLRPKREKGMGLTATPGDGQIELSWTAPSDRSHFREYQYALREGDGAWSNWMTISGAGANTTSHTVTGLTNDTTYSIALWMVREQNGATSYGPLSSVTAVPSD